MIAITRLQLELLGWEAFFDNLQFFIEDAGADRNFGNCTMQRYTCYAAARKNGNVCAVFTVYTGHKHSRDYRVNYFKLHIMIDIL